MERILLIDNHDSFVYNVYHLLKEVSGSSIDIVQNDAINFNSLDRYKTIVISPGPGLPSEAGLLNRCISLCENSHKILGICLGHQAIYEYYGGRLIHSSKIRHGHPAKLVVKDNRDPLLRHIPDQPTVALYNSWFADPKSLPQDLLIGSVDENGNIMSIFHKKKSILGVQFHPESVITNCGTQIIASFLNI